MKLSFDDNWLLFYSHTPNESQHLSTTKIGTSAFLGNWKGKITLSSKGHTFMLSDTAKMSIRPLNCIVGKAGHIT